MPSVDTGKKGDNAADARIYTGPLLCMCVSETHLSISTKSRPRSIILRPLLCKQIWWKYIEIAFVSYNEAKKKSCIWQNGNEPPVNLF